MFDDIKEKLEGDIEYFSQETILGFFQNTLDGLTNDCKRCKDYQETVNVSEYLKQAISRLGALVGTNNSAFVTATLEEITKTLELLDKIPPKLAVPRKVLLLYVCFYYLIHFKLFRVSTSSLRESGITFSEKMSMCAKI